MLAGRPFYRLKHVDRRCRLVKIMHAGSGGPSSARAAFNFAPASGRITEGAVNGCCMPGFSDPAADPGSIGPLQVAEWASYMRAHGVTDAVVLLGDDELSSLFAPPGLAEMYKTEGITPHLLRVRSPGAHQAIMAVFDAVDASGGTRKAVTHCTGGRKRVGCVLTAWLAHKYGLTYEAAAAEMAEHAEAAGVARVAPSAARFEEFVSGQGW